MHILARLKQPNTLINGAISSGSATSITVDTTEGFPDTGTLKIGSDTITYTGKTATTFTFSSTSLSAHVDDTSITLINFTDSIFGFKDELRNTVASAQVETSTPTPALTSGTLTVGSTTGSINRHFACRY